MKTKEKLKALGELAKFDVCGYPQLLQTHKKAQRFSFIYQAMGERGKTMRLFKILQTNQCENNCYYCINRKSQNTKRFSFTPKELATLFMEYYSCGLVQGFFLSSGIYKNPDYSQEEIIQTLRILRKKLHYSGYIHAKILPDTSDELIEEVSKYSDRLSINLEAPEQDCLSRISPDKNFAHLLSKLRHISKVAQKLKSGATTQFMIGSAKESDRSIINLADKLYRELKLKRVYYSGFIPIPDTPMQNTMPCLPRREYRLYQADFLIRKYKFTKEEIPFDENGFLPTDLDPKSAWADIHPEQFPVEINTASFDMLIRVPGIGKISATRIITARKSSKIRTLQVLKCLAPQSYKARNFITLDGHQPPKTETKKSILQKQLFLWEEL